MSFYSPIDRLAQTLPRPKGTGAEFMTELSKMPGYKSQEAEDRGLQALMNLPKMERAQFMEALKAKRPVVPEVKTLRTNDEKRYGPRRYDQEEEEQMPRHESFTLPGGSNYREILLKHPQGEFKGVPQHFGGEPNILASVRAKDRTGPNGEKILHIEELQSDWHQQGRDKGYTPPDVAKQIKDAERAHRGLKQQLEEAKNESGRLEQYLKDPSPTWQNPAAQERVKNGLVEANNKIMELTPQVMKAEALHQDLLHKSNTTAPDAPFKKNWHEMALKKMIHHAAKNGYDAIAITPGAEQAERYNMAQHVSDIRYDPYYKQLIATGRRGEAINKIAEPHELPNYVGKEVAEKLLQTPISQGTHKLSGLDLESGGEGMKGFYDKIVPNFLNQFGKKYGAKVGTKPLAIEGGIEPGWVTKPAAPREVPVHHFPITPAMREDVVKNGVPLYSKGGEVEVKPTAYDPNLQRKHPELEAAIRGIAAGTTTHKQLDKLIAKHKPIKPYEFVPQPASDEDAERALKPAQKPKWRAHEQWPAGRKVGLRLDIPAYENHGVWVNSVHDEEGKGDDNLKVAYGPVSSVKNAVFDPTPHKAEEVGTGEKGKSSFARIKGDLHHMSEDEAVEHMKTYLNHPDYAQIGFDPRRHGFFYDRKTMKPVTHSAHVVQIGPLVLAHKPTYGKRETYAEGGSAEYQGEHKPPSESYGAPLHDLTQVYPEDIYSNKALRYYGMGHPDHKKMDMESLFKAQMYRNKPDASVSVFRAVPEHINEINPSDWVTLSPAYAKLHGESRLGGKYKTLKKMVKAKELWTAGDSIHEWGYHPQEKKAAGGSIKPIGYTKEQVTVSPNLDAMRYELESVKHYTKKVK